MDTNNPGSHAEPGNEHPAHPEHEGGRVVVGGHGDDSSGYVNPEALQRGHEEDKVDAKSILYVPLALVATFVLAYVVVTLMMNYARSPSKEPPNNPVAAKRNDASLNQRFERISSSDPNAEYKQPRLEGLNVVDTADSPYWRSMNPSKDGNSRQFHPEDMRVSSGYSKELGLQDYAWLDKDYKVVHDPVKDHLVIRIPVSKALEIALTMKDPKNPALSYLAIAKEPLPLDDMKFLMPKSGNSHWGIVPAGTADHKDHKEPKGKDKDHKEHN